MAQILAGGSDPNPGGNTQVIQQVQTANWTQMSGKPFTTVSPNGIENGLSSILNDGNDFGPDTKLGATTTGQYGSGGNYTETLGIKESIMSQTADTIATVVLTKGVFELTSDCIIDLGVSGVPSGLNLYGAGRKATVILVSGSNLRGFVLEDTTDASIEDIYFYGILFQTSGTSPQSALNIQFPGSGGQGNTITFDNCAILAHQGPPSVATFYLEGISNPVFTNSAAEGEGSMVLLGMGSNNPNSGDTNLFMSMTKGFLGGTSTDYCYITGYNCTFISSNLNGTIYTYYSTSTSTLQTEINILNCTGIVGIDVTNSITNSISVEGGNIEPSTYLVTASAATTIALLSLKRVLTTIGNNTNKFLSPNVTATSVYIEPSANLSGSGHPLYPEQTVFHSLQHYELQNLTPKTTTSTTLVNAEQINLLLPMTGRVKIHAVCRVSNDTIGDGVEVALVDTSSSTTLITETYTQEGVANNETTIDLYYTYSGLNSSHEYYLNVQVAAVTGGTASIKVITFEVDVW